MTKDEAIDREDLIDAEDGENRALRSFLMQYSCDRSISVGAMLAHMNRSGWRGTAPAFALEVRPETHLTKGGAQIWIRHLIGLEAIGWAQSGNKSGEQAGQAAPKVSTNQALSSANVASEQRQQAGPEIAAQPAADPAPVPAQGIDHAKLAEGAAFEAWAQTCDGNYNRRDIRRYPDGCHEVAVDGQTYINPATERDWLVWQARGQQAGVPEGCVVVPKEPTEAMIQAACIAQAIGKKYDSYDAWWNDHSSGISERIRNYIASDYRVMIAAAAAPGEVG